MSNLPKDPVILLSYVNTQLRDHYPALHELCHSLCIDEDTLCHSLAQINFVYHPETNQFQ